MFCPAYGLAENTLVVSGRQRFYDEPSIFTVVAEKLRVEGIALPAENINSYDVCRPDIQVLVGVGRPFSHMDGTS
jgi:hypothetical protein